MAPGPIQLVGAAALAVVLLGSLSTVAIGVEPIVGTPLPQEPPAIVLADTATGALPFDLDGDGVAELVAVVARADAGGLSALQAWWVAADGSVEASNQVRVRRSASVDELLSGRGQLGIDRDDMIAVRTNEPARLVEVRRDGRRVLLLAATGTEPRGQTSAPFNTPCCLTIWEVTVEGRELDLRLVGATQNFVAEIVAADMDGDRTDELLTTEGPIGNIQSDILDLSLLRWDGERYARNPFTIPFVTSCCVEIADAGDSDGVPGDEVLIKANDPNIGSTLLRVSLNAGFPTVERDPFREALGSSSEVTFARAIGGTAEPTLLVHDGNFMRTWSWPRDETPSVLGRRLTGGTPGAVFGSGPATRIVIVGGFPPASVHVLNHELAAAPGEPPDLIGRDVRSAAFTGVTGLAVQDDSSLTPYTGVFPGGVPGRPEAFVFSGRLVIPLPDPDQLASASLMALLPGVQPMGTLGTDGVWSALLSGHRDTDYRDGVLDLTTARALGTLSVVPTASVLNTEAEGGRLRPTFFGVASDAANPLDLIVGEEAAVAELRTPPGSIVSWTTRGEVGQIIAGPDGVTHITLLPPAGANAPDGSGTTARMWVVTPAGHAYSGSWRISVYRQPPDLGIANDPALIDFSPTVSGETLPGSQLTINGVPAEVAADGSFAVPIEVGILPTEIRVVVVDPVGNRTERVVTRVWPLDYRQLPFVPIVVLVTVAAGVLLFLRRPDAGPNRRTPDDGSTFEEIGG